MKTRKINFYLVFIPILLSFIAILQASWILFDSTPVEDSDNSLIDNTTKVEIGIKYVAYMDLDVTYGEKEIAYSDQTSIDTQYTISDATSYDKLSNLLSSNTYSSIEQLNSVKEHEVNLKDGNYVYIINVTTSISKTSETNSCTGQVSTKYSGKYTICKVPVVKSYSSQIFDNEIKNKITIPINSKFPYQIVQETLILDTNNYAFFGFYNETVEGTPGTTVINKDTVISSACNIYAFFNNKKSSTLPNVTNITSTISSNSSSINIYAGAPSDSNNILKDSSYFDKLNTFSLGSGLSSLEIKSGSTLKFCLNNGSEYIESTKSKVNESINPFDGTHHCNYTISLQTDLIINGTMQIGGHFGSGTNNGVQGNINDEFVCLDLNGKTITINNGAILKSYGMIKDTVGTGEIIVNGGGKIITLGVIHDYKGGNSTMQSTNKNVVPFNNYNIPYVQCRIIFYYNNNSWGTVACIIRIHTTSLSEPSNVSLNLAGQGSGYLFVLKEGSNDSRIIFNSIENELLSNNTYAVKNVTNRKLTMDFYNCDTEFSNLELNAGATINTKNLYFPICSYFNLGFYNSSFSFSQAMQFMFGSSVYFDENSEMIFNYNSDTTATLSILNNTVDKVISDNLIVQNHRAADNQIPSIKTFWNNLDTWKYSNSAMITCKGTTYFTVGNTNPYILGGNININKLGYIDSNGTKTSIEGFDLSAISSKGANIRTYIYDYIPSTYSSSSATFNLMGYSIPLISYHTAIIFDNSSNINLTGQYNKDTGLLTIDNKTYYFNVDDTVTTKRTISLRECSYDENTHLIKDTLSGSYYAFFNNVFLPVTIENNVVNCNPQRITASSTNITITYNETYKYWSR